MLTFLFMCTTVGIHDQAGFLLLLIFGSFRDITHNKLLFKRNVINIIICLKGQSK